MAEPIPTDRSLLTVPGPVDDKGLTPDILQGNEAPRTTVQAVVPVISHDEQVPFRNSNGAEIVPRLHLRPKDRVFAV